MSMLDRLLPEPSFVVRDPQEVVRQMVAQYEQLTGKTLYPAQVERIQIDVAAYRESLVREAIQDAAKLNLVRFSRAPILDYLAENVGVQRLNAVAATTTLRFTFSPVPTLSTLLPAGVLVEGAGLVFQTSSTVLVASGQASVDVPAFCTQVGVVGNGFAPGQINALDGNVPGFAVTGVSNITATAGGANEESDERLRERVVLAPEQFSTAGSAGSYRYHAVSAHPDVVDVAIRSPQLALQSGSIAAVGDVPAGCVYIYPLTRQGLPSTPIKNAVAAACSAETVRPLTDFVQVFDPELQTYALTVQLTILTGADAVATLARAQQAAQEFVAERSSRLGADIVRSQIINVLQGSGVYNVNLVQPAADLLVPAHGWAQCAGISVTVAGVANG